MTTAQVVETSVTVNDNSPIQDYVNPDDQTQPTFVFIIIRYQMILFFPGPQNFVLSFMDKPPRPILMRWIFGPLGQGNSRPLSGFVYHKFGQNF